MTGREAGMTILLSSSGLTGGSTRLCQRSGFPIDKYDDRRNYENDRGEDGNDR